MKHITVIVEGFGDVNAVPSLISLTGNWLGLQLVASRPIRANEWPTLKRPGVLEGYLELARTRESNQILILVDLDDGCALKEQEEAKDRIRDWANGRLVEVGLVFAVREYETMFLHRCVDLNPTFDKKSLGNIDQVRDAKGKVREIIGRRYNEPKDQPVLTKMINFPALYQKSRSYAKLCKEVSGMCYSELDKLSNDLCPSEY